MNLSHLEQEILELLAQGFANKEITTRLSLSTTTVRWHLKRIYQKHRSLDVSREIMAADVPHRRSGTGIKVRPVSRQTYAAGVGGRR